MAIFLHWDFLHIFFNSVALIMIMSYLEVNYGVIVTGLMFLLSGIGGNIFSACVSTYNANSFSAGASTGIFGLVGCLISFMIMNWQALKNRLGSEMRCMMLCMVMMNVMFIWILSGYGEQAISVNKSTISVDGLGHFGGFLCGILLGLWLPKPIEVSGWTKASKLVGMALSFMFYLLSFVLFFTVTAN